MAEVIEKRNEKKMNWIIPPSYNNTEYKNVKCIYCGIKLIFNPNIKSSDDQIILVNLDHSPHNCYELTQKGFMGYDSK